MGRPNVPFSIYPRGRKSGKPVFYVRFKRLDGSLSSGRSSGKTSRDAAIAWALEEITSGRLAPTVGSSPTLNQWAKGFFGVGGRYDQAKRARGHQLSATYLKNCEQTLAKHVLPVFGRRNLDTIRAIELEHFFLRLYRTEGYAGSTVNNILKAVHAIFGEAERLGVIHDSAARRVGRFAANGKERGALTQEELDKLFALEALSTVWGGDRVTYLVCMIAAGCGLRHSEVLALRPQDFIDGVVHVTRAWDRGLSAFGPPKWNSRRETPVPDRLQQELTSYVKEKEIGPDDLLFPSTVPGQPMDAKPNVAALHSALEKIGIAREEQGPSRRFLDIHSLRHTYISRLRAGDVPDWQIQRTAGHRSLEMTDNYTHARGGDLSAVAGLGSKILPFKKASGDR